MDTALFTLISEKFPTFVKDSYPEFAKFLENYYKWLDKENNFNNILESWLSLKDASNNTPVYIDKTLGNLGFNFDTSSLTISKSEFISQLRNFYLSRGSKISFEYLFKVLFNASLELNYPRERMFYTSKALYGSKFFVYLKLTESNKATVAKLATLVKDYGGTLQGVDSGLQASVESIKPIFGDAYIEVQINEPNGVFIVRETCKLSVSTLQIFEEVQNVLTIDITSGGNGFKEGEQVSISGCAINGFARLEKTSKGGITSLNIINQDSSCLVPLNTFIFSKPSNVDNGFGFTAKVTKLTSPDNLIDTVEILNKGYNYKSLPNLYFKLSEKSAIDDDPCNEILQPSSQEIGKIEKISFKYPFIDFDKSLVNISVNSLTGSGEILSASETTVFKTTGWENLIGVLGINTVLTDSLKYQQFSYEILSSIPPSRYIDVVKDLLHPSGFLVSPVIFTEFFEENLTELDLTLETD